MAKTNRAGVFSFGGRYTLRNVAGTWNVYDRKTGGCVKPLWSQTFTKAQKELIAYKKERNDRL